jgi:hypothetical protein
MRFTSFFRLSFSCITITLACAAIVNAQTPSEGVPPRAAPGDYQAAAKAGSITVAAEFVQHSVPTPEATFTTDDYIVVEAGLFGAAGQKLAMSPTDFSLRVNGKKQALPSQPFPFIQKSLKDPEWEMNQVAEKAEKSRIGVGADANNSGEKPAPPKMPFDLQRVMDQKVQKASFPEGARPLPQAGLLYFEYRGGLKGLRQIELLYSSPAGKATLLLQR